MADPLPFETRRDLALAILTKGERLTRHSGSFLGQANSRATLEALTKLHQPREQTVRHVHVNDGGQAVIADQFHHHTGGQETENGKAAEQSHAPGKARDAAGQGPALPRPDTFGNAMPIPGSERAEAVLNARRHKPRRTGGE